MFFEGLMVYTQCVVLNLLDALNTTNTWLVDGIHRITG